MNWDTALYYAGYALALIVCRSLGKLIFVPMALNMVFNIFLEANLLSGWDIRWVIVIDDLLFFLWVLFLTGSFDKVAILCLVAFDALSIYHGVWPQLTMTGDGQEFWNETSTNIDRIWMTSILVITMATIAKDTIGSRIRQGYVELLAIPRHRFLIPIALWSAIIVIPDYFKTIIPPDIFRLRFNVAAHVLVWGWFAVELPFFLLYRRLKRRVD